MLFNSLHYLVYFPVVAALYFAFPPRWKWVLLLVASYYFYMCWRIEYTLMLVFITVLDYWAALDMVKHPPGSFRRKLPLFVSLAGNLGLLFTFKYWNFFNEVTGSVLGRAGIPWHAPVLAMLLPVGISFHTFQSVGYNIDVYRGKVPPERHFGIFALFVAYFPQLVAGPIERAEHILPQLRTAHRFDAERIVRGLQLATWGMFKKVVIADRLSAVVNSVYNDLPSHPPVHVAVATVFFAFQIYCDFSGYTDIALGSAEVLGVRLVKNFDRPYFARSIAEFWKRWHISLSSWFRDYVYIPLGGSRVPVPHWYFNLFVTFLVSGLWHGARWTFVVWGALNGLYLIAEIVLARPVGAITRALRLDRAPGLLPALGILVTFTLTCFAWIFFRANSLADAGRAAALAPAGAATLLGTLLRLDFVGLYGLLRGVGLQQEDFFLAFGSIAVLLVVDGLGTRFRLREWIGRWPTPVRWATYYASLASILLFGAFNSSQQFIYFQF